MNIGIENNLEIRRECIFNAFDKTWKTLSLWTCRASRMERKLSSTSWI